MANTQSAFIQTQLAGRANPSRLPAANVASSTIQIASIPFDVPAGAVVNDTVELCLLPAGSIPVPGLSSVNVLGAAPSVLTLDVGTAAAPDSWGKGGDAFVGANLGLGKPPWGTPTPLVADDGFGSAKIIAKIKTLTGVGPCVANLAYKIGR
jgi:hypothetical protein